MRAMTVGPRLVPKIGPAACIAVSAVLFTSLATADKRADSEQKFRAGQTAFEIGDYATATQAFEESYALLPLPAIRFSLAQAYRLQYYQDKMPWRAAAAAALYREYVDEVKMGGRVPDATQWLGELEPLVAVMTPSQRQRPTAEKVTKVVIYSSAPGATIKLGSQSSPSPFTATVEPGSYQFDVAAPGFYSQTQQVIAIDGVLTDKEVVLRPMPARIKIPKDERLVVRIDGRRAEVSSDVALAAEGPHIIALSRPGRVPRIIEASLGRDEFLDLSAPLAISGQRKWAKGLYWTSGVVALGAGSLVGLAVFHDRAARRLLDRSDDAGLALEEAADYQRHRRERDEFRMWSYIGGGAAIVTASIATVLFFTDHKQPETASDAPTPGLAPVVNDDVVGLAWTARY